MLCKSKRALVFLVVGFHELYDTAAVGMYHWSERVVRFNFTVWEQALQLVYVFNVEFLHVVRVALYAGPVIINCSVRPPLQCTRIEIRIRQFLSRTLLLSRQVALILILNQDQSHVSALQLERAAFTFQA